MTHRSTGGSAGMNPSFPGDCTMAAKKKKAAKKVAKKATKKKAAKKK
jgi:hypothetical protein